MYKKILFVLFVSSLASVANSQFVKPEDLSGYSNNSMKSSGKLNDQYSDSLPYDSLARGTNTSFLKLGYQIGFGTYSMNNLKDINDQVSESLPFDSKIVDNFPGYLYFRPSVALEFAKYSIGLICSFQSTGSRISSKDFSGEYRFDTKVKSTSPGIYGDIKLLSQKKSRLCVYSIAGLIFSKLNIHETLSLKSSHDENQNIDFKAQNYFLEPGIDYSYSIGSLSVGLNVACFITIGSQAFYSGDNKKNSLQISKNNQDVKPDWNGIRSGFSILYTFRSKQ
jgi:hypothetical protein